jgi:hypothetical protein
LWTSSSGVVAPRRRLPDASVGQVLLRMCTASSSHLTPQIRNGFGVPSSSRFTLLIDGTTDLVSRVGGRPITNPSRR